MTINRQIILSEYPKGMPQAEHLPLREGAIPTPQDGQVLIKTIYLSLDPYMRGR
ncbi:MAG: NADP-dependent oxidoreductase, partial [Alcanivorax sp.]|nr:NADP-dependent oxidoreductase [Alcanivorax sp.]